MSMPVRNLEQLFADNGVVEVRCLGPSTLVGRFDDPELLRAAVRKMDATHSCYATLNRPRSTPITNWLIKGSKAFADDDIEQYTRLLFDFDPVRAKTENSTDEQIDEARQRAMGVQAYLTSWGWPEPLQGCSGNGWHLQYRIKLKNSEEHRKALTLLYRDLATKFSDDVVAFDATTRNPSRICRLYGTVNRKAPASEGRPNRRSSCYVPRDWRCVPHRAFNALAATCREKPKPKQASQRLMGIRVSDGAGDYSTLDAAGWFRSHGLLHDQVEPGMWAVTCPWAHEHTSESPKDHRDCILWESGYNDWPTFHCKHAHCDGRSIQDVMRELADADAFCSKVWGVAS